MTQFESKEDFAEALMTFRALHPPKVEKPARKSKYDPEEIRRMRLEGITVEEIAKKYGVKRQTISSVITRHGLGMKTQYDLEDVKKMLESGATRKEIAEKYGVSEKAIYNYLQRQGFFKKKGGGA